MDEGPAEILAMFEGERPIALAEIARLFRKPNGKAMRIETIHRWWKVGKGGKKLRVAQIGGRYYTTAKWFQEFGVIHNAPEVAPKPLTLPKQDSKSVAAARRFLASKGLRCGSEARNLPPLG